MKSPRRSHPLKKASCAKRNMRWVAKSKDHVGYCRPKHNKMAKSKSRSRKSKPRMSK